MATFPSAAARVDLFSMTKPQSSRSAYFPFLAAVDRRLSIEAQPVLPPRPLSFSQVTSRLPFSKDLALRESYRGFFGDIRLGKVPKLNIKIKKKIIY
jgi:hypothetical protein